jgi:hypothetical protein
LISIFWAKKYAENINMKSLGRLRVWLFEHSVPIVLPLLASLLIVRCAIQPSVSEQGPGTSTRPTTPVLTPSAEPTLQEQPQGTATSSPTATAGPTMQTQILDPFQVAEEEYLSGNYLAPLIELERLEAVYLDSPLRDFFLEAIGNHSSYVGNYQDALYYYDQILWDFLISRSPELDKCTPRDALDVISELGNTHQVVFINEAHHIPLHRAFSIAVLGVLRDKGFSYSAAETLDEADTQLNQRGYPLFGQTGYLTDEPVYGDLIRTALKLSYQVIPYEDAVSDDTDGRERGQAQNLADRIFRRDPSAKVIVHAGYGHIAETGDADFTPMAVYFKEITGIDPITINQTVMTEQSSPDYENECYRDVVDRGLVTNATIFQCEEDFWAHKDYRDFYDILFFHPRTQYENGRPTWMQLGGTRTFYQLSEGVCDQSLPCLVQAIAIDEDPMAVPIDQIEIRSLSELPALVLPKGEFIVRARDATGEIINEFRITVE